MRLYGTLQELSSLTIRTTNGDTVQLVAAEQSHASGAVSVTIPDLGASSNSDEIVMVTLSQTLLNKTLTSPVMTSASINSSSVLQLPLSAPGTNALGRLYVVGSDLRLGTSATPGAYEQVVTQTSSSILTNKTINLASGNGNSVTNANPTSLLATEVTNADKVVRYDGMGIPVIAKVSNLNIADNADISGTKLANNSVNVSKLVTAETTGSGNVVLQTNPTLSSVIAQSGVLTVSGTGALRLPFGDDTQKPGGLAANLKGMIRYNDEQDAFEGYNELSGWSALGGGGASERVSQTGLGVAANFPVGTPLYVDAALGWQKAKADAANTAEVAGILGRRIDDNTVEVTLAGEVTGVAAALFENPASLPPRGELVFLSPTTAGKLTTTEPTVVGQVSKPVGIVHNVIAGVSVDIMFFNMRGTVVGGANLRTQIGLNGDPLLVRTTNIQNVTAYTAGELSGWVYIDATTDRRFYIQVQFVKDAANAWKCAYQTTGDTPPAGFNVDVVVVGADAFVQVQMPAVAGWVSGSINFALNAPAVGATLPLQISGGNVTGPVLGAGTGAAIAAGYIGEKYESVELYVAASSTGATVGTLTNLPPGVWLIQVAGMAIDSSGTLTAGQFVGLPTTNASLNPIVTTNGWYALESGAYSQAFSFSAANTIRTSGNGSTIVNITSPTTYYHRVSWSSTGGGIVGIRGYIRAVRIA